MKSYDCASKPKIRLYCVFWDGEKCTCYDDKKWNTGGNASAYEPIDNCTEFSLNIDFDEEGGES